MKYTFEDLFKLLIKKAWLIILCSIITGSTAYLITTNIIPATYTSSAQIYVTINENTKGMSSSEALSYSKNMSATYEAFLKTNEFLQNVKTQSNSSYSTDKIKKMTTVSSVSNTGIFNISVETNSIEESYQIAKAITELAPDKIKSIESEAEVSTIDFPSKAKTKTSPNEYKNILIGVVLGFMISLTTIIFIDVFDIKIKNSQIIKDKYNIPIIGKIPSIKN